MNPERWQRIEELFRTVVDRPAPERESYLTRVCNPEKANPYRTLPHANPGESKK
ncbi:MAG: hypothetical protein ACREAM_27605 [Blastocatellia bacterium]